MKLNQVIAELSLYPSLRENSYLNYVAKHYFDKFWLTTQLRLLCGSVKEITVSIPDNTNNSQCFSEDIWYD